MRFVLAKLRFLAGFLAVGRCPGRKSVDCAKLAVRRRSQEAQLDEDRGFKMKLDGFVSNISCVKCLLFIYVKIFFGNYDNMLCPTHCMLFNTEGCVQQL